MTRPREVGRTGTRVAVLTALGLEGVIALADALSPDRDILVSALVLPPLLLALLGAVEWTTLVAGVAVALAVASGSWNDNFGMASWSLPLAIVVVGGVVAVVGARARDQSRSTLERMRLLADITEVPRPGDTLAQTAEALAERIVPLFADGCLLDVFGEEGVARRLQTRAIGSPEAEAALRRTHPPTEEALAGGGQLYERVDEATLRRAAGREEDVPVLRALGLRSAIVVPLRSRGRILGALSLAYGSSGRRYRPSDLRFAQVVAGRAALALETAGLAGELWSTELRLDAILSSMTEAVTVRDVEGRSVYANDAAVRLLGAESVDELLRSGSGELMARFDVYREDGTPIALEELPGARILAGEEEAPAPMLVRNIRRDTGEERWLLNKASAIRDAEGRVRMAVNLIEDVTDETRAERAQRLLAEAGRALAVSLDYEQTLQRVAELAVPALADWCGVDLPGPHGEIVPVAIAHSDPEKVALARRLRERHPVDPDEPAGLAAVMRGEPSQIVESVSDADLVAAATDVEHLEMLRAIGFGSIMIVPMRAHGETVGALTFVSALRRFTPSDLELAEDLGRRAGTAVQNARLYTERSRIAATLEQSLMPAPLPEIAGWEIAARYRPAGYVNEVGGDFYEVFPLRDRWAVVVGDVGGKGARAAALTGLARHSLRTALTLTGDAGRALRQLNELLLEQPDVSLCSVVIAEVAAVGGDVTVRSAGHPPALLLGGGRVEELVAPGPMLGIVEQAAWPSMTANLAVGDRIVLYTDGVLDAAGPGGRFGPGRLRAAALAAPPGAARVVREIEGRLEAFVAGPRADDVAIVALERTA